MTENEYQQELLTWLSDNMQDSAFFSKLPLRYEIGKYYSGKVLGMPDCELDIVEVDQEYNFHLWELKKLDSNELNTGKFFGQLMLYDFLFTTEPWNELFGRFCTKLTLGSGEVTGDIQRIYDAILRRTSDENTEYADEEKSEVIGGEPICSFKSWKLIVCGGYGYEIAAGFNPIIWSYLNFPKQYLNETAPELEIYHFYNTPDGYELKPILELSVDNLGGLSKNARTMFEYNFPDWDKE